MIALRYSAPSAPDFHDDLVFVTLDEPYAERTLYAPTHRLDLLADIIDSVTVRHPRTLALDVHIEGARLDTAGFAAYEDAVARAAHAGVRVVLPIRVGGFGADLSTGRNVRVVAAPSPALDSVATEGYVDFSVRYQRRGVEGLAESVLGPPAVLDLPLVTRLDDSSIRLSFPLAAAAVHEGLLDRDDNRGEVHPDTVSAVLAAFGRSGIARGEVVAPLHYEGPAAPSGSERPRVIPADDLSGPTATADIGPLDGALVLVAAVYPSADGSDTAATPFGAVRGGVIQFHAIDTLLRRAYPVRCPPWPGYLLGAALAALAIGLSRLSVRLGVAVTVIALAIYIAIAFSVAQEDQRVFLPLAGPLWGTVWGVVAGYVFGRRE